MIIFFLILFGLLALYIGAELLVRYSVHLAAALGVSSLMIGLTVVAYGTSTPELIVNIIASWMGNTEIALGNIVGSNIFNVLFILGISALICPLIVHKQIVKLDIPLMILASLMTWFFASFGNISFWVGILFLVLAVLYTLLLIHLAKKEKKDTQSDEAYVVQEKSSWKVIVKDISMIVVSLIILVIGSQSLVKGAVNLAQLLGVSELVISLTIVAAGTGLPELATSAIAAMRGQRDIAVGNVIGSNIYNIWAILGVSAVLAPAGIPVPNIALSFDIPVMVAVAIACLPIFFTNNIIYRWEGGVFLGYYFAYLFYLILRATSSVWLNTFQDAMYFFFFPLTGLSLLIGVVNQFRAAK